MARKTRQRISYVLPLANATAGHRLGVNGLSLDSEGSILYTAGRDGVIYAWDTHTTQPRPAGPPNAAPAPVQAAATYRQHVQAHTHWINDLVLVNNNSALVSASSDNSVRLWRPHAEDITPPQTIGLHNDYVKCLSSPGRHASWLASGGLDQKIRLWDLARGGEKLQIQNVVDEYPEKGSIYALYANESIIASGGPESVVNVWDSRSGKRITKFAGHTDNIRSILISQDSDTIMTASSDQTVKVWSMVAGRCIHTLTMHNDSVWSLYSDHPQLSVFYSGDRAGFVAKTDTRGVVELDEGMSVALCQEQGGVARIITAGSSFWTATASSSVNKWADVDTSVGLQIPDSMKSFRWGSSRTRTSISSPPAAQSAGSATSGPKIPLKCLLRMSNTATFPPPPMRAQTDRSLSQHTMISARKASTTIYDPEIGTFEPLRSLPVWTIEGQIGLIKHIMLNDKRRVLTLDTAGEVVMWDLLRCTPIRSFGKRHLEDVVPEVNTTETVAHWCAVDTRTGNLTCVLEANYCFDAEMYADELKEAEYIPFREDQRINLGKWVLRYLFASLLDEEIRRDEVFRSKLQSNKANRAGIRNRKPQLSIHLPQAELDGWSQSAETTPRAVNGRSFPMTTPGLSIGLATPGGPGLLSPSIQRTNNPTSPSSNGVRSSQDPPIDYFSSRPETPELTTPSGTTTKIVATPSEGTDDRGPLSPSETERNGGKGLGMKRLRMSFVGKKIARPAVETPKPVISNISESDTEATSKAEEPIFDDSFYGTIQRIHSEYAVLDAKGEAAVETLVLPGLPDELPVLKPPLTTTVIIQEESPDHAGIQDLYEGNIGSLSMHADRIEKVAPIWLGDALLRNRAPNKEVNKVSFILEPFDKSLPNVTANEGTERLNANRMLRARKVMGYVAERLDPRTKASEPDLDSLQPEEYLEILCQNQLVPPKMTLATIRTHIWRGGGDVVLVYKFTGRRRPVAVAPSVVRGTNPFRERMQLSNGQASAGAKNV